MEKTLLKKQIEAIKELSWYVEQKGEDVIIEGYSPLGENLYEELDGNNLVRACKKLYENYDADNHVELWIEHRGKNGVPSSIIDLCEDAKAIENMYYKLYQKVLSVN